MKKIAAVVMIGLLVVALGAAVVSASPGWGGGMRGPNGQAAVLTDAQKQELVPLQNQMFELRKQMIQKFVGFGNLTQEQADWRIGRMKERHEAMLKGEGFGHRGGCMGNRGPGGPGAGPRGPQQSPTK